MNSTTTSELAHRANDGVEVSLLWSRTSGRLAVVVSDSRAGDTFELPADAHNALDVFYHPYAYAASHGIEYALQVPCKSTEVVVA